MCSSDLDLTFSQYLALLKVGDAFIVTSLREGMALRTHEFVECQEGRCRPLILSEVSFQFPSLDIRISDCEVGVVYRQLLVLWIPFLHCYQPLGQARNCRRNASSSHHV